MRMSSNPGQLKAPRLDFATGSMTIVASIYAAANIACAPDNSRCAKTDEPTGGIALPVAPEVMGMMETGHPPVPHASPPVGTSIALANRRSPVQAVA